MDIPQRDGMNGWMTCLGSTVPNRSSPYSRLQTIRGKNRIGQYECNDLGYSLGGKTRQGEDYASRLSNFWAT